MPETHHVRRAGLDRLVKHRTVDLDGVEVFYREAGPSAGPALLLPHGYPGSSMEFRNLMPALADRYRVLAPDFPGQGLSATPPDFDYSFEGYAQFLERFARRMGLGRFVLWLHDFGSQIGLRLAIRRPEWIAGLVVQNGDIYADTLGPKYEAMRRYFADKSEENFAPIAEAVSLDGFEDEYRGNLRPELRELVPPELWLFHWSLVTPRRREIILGLIRGLEQNLDRFSEYQAYLRAHQPPTLILWGPQDGFMPEAAGRAYLRDLPEADLHILDAGHWALETNLEQVVELLRPWLERLEP